MKHLFLFALLLAGPALRAQSKFTILNDLEGRWYQEGRQLATYSEWHFTDKQTIVYQLIKVKCGVTSQMSHAVLRFTDTSATLLCWADSLSAEVPQIFRLSQVDADAIVFQNEDATAQPQQLGWAFSRHGYLTAQADAVESIFFRQMKKGFRPSMTLRLGANFGKLANRIQPQDHRYYTPGVGVDLAISFGLRGNGPLGLNFELGLNQHQAGLSAQWQDATGRYNRVGTCKLTDFYAAFVPELLLGKKQQFSLSAGVSTTFAHKNDFQGTTKSSYLKFNQETLNSPFYVGYDTKLLAGFSWQLPKSILPTLQPSVYCRGSWGLGYAKVRLVSVGVGVRLK